MEEKTFTQEELNSIVGERLGKEKERMSALTSEWETQKQTFESKIATLTKEMEDLKRTTNDQKALIDEKDLKIKRFETQSVKMRVANEFGIPYELATRLTGETEEDIKRDAETMKGLLNTSRNQPIRLTEPSPSDAVSSAMRELISKI